MVDLQNIHHIFASESILESVNLTIEEGKAVVILGPSGLGKSTLLKIIAGIITPTKGSILLDQKSPQEWLRNPKQIPISMLFQKNALFDSQTVFENTAFALREKEIYSEDEINKIVLTTLESVGLLAAKDLYPDEISGGMQKRLGIARSMALAPKYLLYDDPTAGLDPITSRGIAKLIREIQNQHHMTIVSVTNDMDRARQLGEVFWFVYDRQVKSFNTFSELEASEHPFIYSFIRGLDVKSTRVTNA